MAYLAARDAAVLRPPLVLPVLSLPKRQSISPKPKLRRNVSCSKVEILKAMHLRKGLKFLEDIGYCDPGRSVSSRKLLSYVDFLGKAEAQKLIKKLGYLDAIPAYNRLHSGDWKLPALSYPNYPAVMHQHTLVRTSSTKPSRRSPSNFKKETAVSPHRKALQELDEKLDHFKSAYSQFKIPALKPTTQRLTDREFKTIQALEVRLR
jgi:hypothetical protein